jgi:exodeoxyribonuclease VII large subunit
MFLQQAMRLTQAKSQVRALDPVNVLKRGYSITYFKGKALKDAAAVSLGDEIITRLYSGTVSSEVKSKSE